MPGHDPKLFNNSLAEEYWVLHNELGFTLSEIHLLIEQAVDSCWLPRERKAKLAGRIREGTHSIDITHKELRS